MYDVLFVLACCASFGLAIEPVLYVDMDSVTGQGKQLKAKPKKFDCHDVCTLVDRGDDNGKALQLENWEPNVANATEFASAPLAKAGECLAKQNCPNGFSISVWTKLNSDRLDGFHFDAIIGTDGYDGFYLEFWTTYKYLRFLAQRDGHYFTINCWLPYLYYDVWTHWAIVVEGGFFDNSTFRAYRDGVEEYCTTYYDFTEEETTDERDQDIMYIGCNRGNLDDPDQCSTGFHGDIDNIKLYDAPLSETEVQTLYSSEGGF